MDLFVISMLEVVQELLRDTRLVVIELALIVVQMLGLGTGRRRVQSVLQVSATGLQPGQSGPDPDWDHVVGTGRRIRPADVVVGKVAVLRWTLRGLGLAGIAVVGSLVGIEFFGTEPILRWSLARLELKSGIRVTFERATGGLLSGQFVLHRVHTVRENHPASNFDLTSSRVTVRCSLWKVLGPDWAVDGLHIEQASGSYHCSAGLPRAPRPETTLAEPATKARVEQLRVQAATITYTDSTMEGDPVQIDLAIDSLECAPVRAAQAPFDLIFRSNAAGTIEGRPFLIKTTHSPTTTKTEWRATGLPIALVGAYLEGPFRWLHSGECDVSIAQQLHHERTLPVTLEAHLILRNVRPGVPDNAKPAVALAAQLLISRIQRFPKEKDVGFTLEIDSEKFDLTKTEDRNQLWKQFQAAAVAALLQSIPVKVKGSSDEAHEQLERTVDKVTNKAIQAIEKLRVRRQARKTPKGEKPTPPAPAPPD